MKNKKIATIIACRLKSTRLPRKALLKIGELYSIELCIKNSLKFENVDHTVLATSNLKDDAELKEHTYRKEVVFYAGDPEDLLRRYLGVIDELGIDIVIRVTGDMPYVSNDILQVLLRSHLDKGADFTAAKFAAIGTNLEIINDSAIRRAHAMFPNADHSEYMSFYFKNNPSVFKLNYVELPAELVRDYRLTLDYQEDLDMFRRIEAHFSTPKVEYGIKDIFKYLDENPQIAKLNASCVTKYIYDAELVKKINIASTLNV